MEIWLNKEFCILSNRHEYILGQKWKDRVLHIGLYIDIQTLLQDYIELRCRTEKEITTTQQLLNYQKSILTSLNKALQPLKIEVKRLNG